MNALDLATLGLRALFEMTPPTDDDLDYLLALIDSVDEKS